MAFTLQAIAGSTTVTLTDGNPFTLRAARGMGGAPVRRVTSQGPAQHGDTDLGYRLNPREVELEIGFSAASDALLDAHRDTLTSIFKPLTSTPINLKVTRDDGNVRQLDCYCVGEITISLVPEFRPGHYHTATVRLYAPEPAWYTATAGTITGTAPLAADWYLAGGLIGSAQVMMQGSVPTNDEAWSYTGTITTSESYTLALFAEYVSSTGSAAYMFRGNTSFEPLFYRQTDTGGLDAGNPRYRYHTDKINSLGMTAGTQPYFYESRPAPIDGVTWITPDGNNFAALAGSVVGTAMQWRENSWPGAIALYALYKPALSTTQRSALETYMTGAFVGTVEQVIVVPYAGDLPEYPTINITGPIADVRIVNTVTDEALDFGTVSIGAGTTYVVDTRPNYKTVLAGTVNKRTELSSDSDLATWHLAPAPVAMGGTNTITVYGTGAGTATRVQVIYYDRFVSY